MLGLYTIYDDKAEKYGRVLTADTDSVAIRDFCGAIKSSADHRMFAEDYRLFRIGTFDENFGALESESPKLVLDGSVAKKMIEAAE